MSVAHDLVITDLADENAALRERAALGESYLELAKQAIEELHEQHREIERQRRQLAALRDEVRKGRADVDEAAAA